MCLENSSFPCHLKKLKLKVYFVIFCSHELTGARLSVEVITKYQIWIFDDISAFI